MLNWLKLKFLTLMQEKLIFKPLRKQIAPKLHPSAYDLTAEELALTTEDGITLACWHRPAQPNTPFLVVFHGNTGHFADVGAPKRGESYDPQYRLTLLQEIEKQGWGYLAVSLRGYGNSSDVPVTEAGIIKDIAAVTTWLKTQNIAQSQLGLLGESLGGAVAFICAEAMALHSLTPHIIATIAPFASLKMKVLDLHPALAKYDLDHHLRHPLDSEKRLQSLTPQTQLLLFHPDADETTPKHHSEYLHQMAHSFGLNTTLIPITGGHITWQPADVIGRIAQSFKAT